MRKWTGGRTLERLESPAVPRYWAAPGRPVRLAPTRAPRRWRRALLHVVSILCPPLGLALQGRFFFALVAGGVLAALRVWYVPELLPLAFMVWALLALLALVVISGD